MNDPTLHNNRFINPDPKLIDDICEDCHFMLRTRKGIFRLITSGYMHRRLRWTHEDMSLPEGDKPVPPPTTSPNQSDHTLLGWGCVICGLILSSPKASQKGSEITHPSVYHKYNPRVPAFRSISFRPIIANQADEEVENPFKDQALSRTSRHPTILNMTEVVEYFHENHIHIKGVIVMRGAEEIVRVPWHLPMWSIFIRRDLRFRVKGVFQNG
ncbi:a5ff69bf-2b84-4b3d-a6b4-95e303d8d382 [Sclerotinia trifoliorum]|uniref:A5ff69bf-2b84-4b3d-a6b4-95e303d8d382 n=1 Tax=Sclerotinia trifoliorum TaxID=28548 RepID=A0A8H2W3T4_9HELO|nr:a5ff69bf-2b84-4b3d-a6b4-95e303d8d382 [Sclerotinia trifoliorum]